MSILAQLFEIGGSEEIVERRGHAILLINLAALQSLVQVFWRHIDVDDLVGFGEDAVGKATGDLLRQ